MGFAVCNNKSPSLGRIPRSRGSDLHFATCITARVVAKHHRFPEQLMRFGCVERSPFLAAADHFENSLFSAGIFEVNEFSGSQP